MLFTALAVGFAGRAHDARAFRNSNFYVNPANRFESINMLYGGDEYHLLGDRGFALFSYLMTPFMDNGRLTAAEKNYNEWLASLRSDIERAFGKLKGRWKVMKEMTTSDIKNIKVFSAFGAQFISS